MPGSPLFETGNRICFMKLQLRKGSAGQILAVSNLVSKTTVHEALQRVIRKAQRKKAIPLPLPVSCTARGVAVCLYVDCRHRRLRKVLITVAVLSPSLGPLKALQRPGPAPPTVQVVIKQYAAKSFSVMQVQL